MKTNEQAKGLNISSEQKSRLDKRSMFFLYFSSLLCINSFSIFVKIFTCEKRKWSIYSKFSSAPTSKWWV